MKCGHRNATTKSRRREERTKKKDEKKVSIVASWPKMLRGARALLKPAGDLLGETPLAWPAFPEYQSSQTPCRERQPFRPAEAARNAGNDFHQDDHAAHGSAG